METVSFEIEVGRAVKELIPSFHSCLDGVAKEKRFIEIIEAPPLEKIMSFTSEMIDLGAPVTFAVLGSEVVGWCDIAPFKNPRMSHRGGLGMGVKAGFRDKGLGSKLLGQTLNAAQEFGLEKVELQVYASNARAIKLYEKFGFEPEGYIKNFRRLDGENFDCIMMSKFLR